ncbi:hypothetical protein ACIA5H_37270 [Nocardia sp. NPDC051900]|uniref:hypothetical protein n=1 Tax=Nocardia sp. NPDC051900 TaxID=3364326 RepID=UPI00379C836F
MMEPVRPDTAAERAHGVTGGGQIGWLAAFMVGQFGDGTIDLTGLEMSIGRNRPVGLGMCTEGARSSTERSIPQS